MRTDQPAYTIYNAEERAFLERMFLSDDQLADRLERYLAIEDPMQLHMQIMEDGPRVSRKGWVDREVPDPEHIVTHTAKLIRLTLLKKGPPGVDMQRLPSMAMLHDQPEIICKDFTPQDDITSDDKHQLERLSARAMFHRQPHMLDLVEEYIAQETITSQWLHDLDKMEAVLQAIDYEAQHPQFVGKLYKEFAGYTGPRLKTEEGRRFFDECAENLDTLRAGMRRAHHQEKSGAELG